MSVGKLQTSKNAEKLKLKIKRNYLRRVMAIIGANKKLSQTVSALTGLSYNKKPFWSMAGGGLTRKSKYTIMHE
jgi:hypothetical protein